MLEHHAHFLAMFINIDLLIGDLYPFKCDFTAVRHFQKVQTPQKSAFSTSTGANDGHHFSHVHMLVDIAEHLQLSKTFA